MTTAYRDLTSPDLWERSLERSLKRRELVPRLRREANRRKRVSAAVATAMLAGQGAPAAFAQAGGKTDSAVSAESPGNRAVEIREGGLPLKVGSTGELVVQVQRALGIDADGVFGAETDGAVRRFQYAAKLQVDGIVGPRTWSALFAIARPASADAGSGLGAAATDAPTVGGPGAPPRVERKLQRTLRRAGETHADGSAGGSAPERGSPGASGGQSGSSVGGRAEGGWALENVTAGSCGSTRISAPVRGTVTSNFGPRGGRMHEGIDIAAPTGTAVKAAACGVVTVRGWVSGYGNMVCITHTSSFSTCYAHLSGYGTSRGARVRQGQVIGYVGCTGHCTGPHLHFETRVNGRPQDPRPYLSGRSIPGKPRVTSSSRRARNDSTAGTARSSATGSGSAATGTGSASAPSETSSTGGTSQSGTTTAPSSTTTAPTASQPAATTQSGATQPAATPSGTSQPATAETETISSGATGSGTTQSGTTASGATGSGTTEAAPAASVTAPSAGTTRATAIGATPPAASSPAATAPAASAATSSPPQTAGAPTVGETTGVGGPDLAAPSATAQGPASPPAASGSATGGGAVTSTAPDGSEAAAGAQ